MTYAGADRDRTYGMPPQPKRRWARRIGTGFVVLLVALVALHAGWAGRAGSRLRQELDGYRAAGEPTRPADFMPAAVPDELNAAAALREADRSIVRTTEAWKRYDELENSSGEPQIPLTAEEFEIYARVVAENPAAYAAVRRAAARPQVEWGVTPAPDQGPVLLNLNLDYLNGQRALARLLRAAALRAHEAGDDAEALARVADLMVLGRAVDRQPMLVPHLVSIGISAIACDVLAQVAPGLRADERGAAAGAARGSADGTLRPARPAARAQVTALIGELLDEGPLVTSRQRMMLGERMMLVDAAEAVADGRLALNKLQSTPTDGEKAGFGIVGYALRPMALTDARIMARHTTAVRDALAAPDYPSFQARAPQSTKTELASPRALHIVASILMPSTDRVAMQDYKILANRRMTAVALACRLYALDHDGQLPAALSDLVPKYLPAVPTDPLTTGRPLGYVPDPDRPVVYNVGENEKDDGGYEPDPTLSKLDWVKLADDVRHLRHQPRRVVAPGEVDPVLPHGPHPDEVPPEEPASSTPGG